MADVRFVGDEVIQIEHGFHRVFHCDARSGCEVPAPADPRPVAPDGGTEPLDGGAKAELAPKLSPRIERGMLAVVGPDDEVTGCFSASLRLAVRKPCAVDHPRRWPVPPALDLDDAAFVDDGPDGVRVVVAPWEGRATLRVPETGTITAVVRALGPLAVAARRTDGSAVVAGQPDPSDPIRLRGVAGSVVLPVEACADEPGLDARPR